MAVASLLVHLHALGINMDTALAGDKMMLDLVILSGDRRGRTGPGYRTGDPPRRLV